MNNLFLYYSALGHKYLNNIHSNLKYLLKYRVI